MIRIRDIALPPSADIEELKNAAAQMLHLPPEKLGELKLRKRSLDARHKDALKYIYTVDVSVSGEDNILKKNRNPKVTRAEQYEYTLPRPAAVPELRPVVAGFGPAGIFAALVLAEAGMRPLILERGQPVELRRKKVEEFWAGGRLDPECNVQFGEGGAGAFSDGKLNTGTKNGRIGWVLECLHRFGAPESVTYDARPHVGTDILAGVVRGIRGRILDLGGEIRFGARLNGLGIEDGVLRSVKFIERGAECVIPCESLILALGHSARDSFEMLADLGVPMIPKAFSMGVRIEHRQSDIDRTQYGDFAGKRGIPAADYRLAVHLPEGDAYTFCMCPGGYVVAAASEEGRLVTNGMSYSGRDGENANSGLLVAVKPEDFPYEGVLGGMYWQRDLEKAAYDFGGGNYLAPAQLVGDFLAHRPSTAPRSVKPSYKPGVVWGELHELLGEHISAVLEAAIPELGKKLHGFDSPDAVLTAVEARSSSPVRILRGDDRQSPIRGLYPCGEGAGYAGGIVSAAVDGMLSAEAICGVHE